MELKRDKYTVIYIFLAIFLIYTVIRFFLRPFDEDTYTLLTDTDTFLIAAMPGIIYILVAQKFNLETTSGKIWLLLGIGFVFWGIGDFLWAIFEIVLSTDNPFASFPDVAWMLGYPFFFAGLLWEFKIIDIEVEKRNVVLLLLFDIAIALIVSFLVLIPILTYTEEVIPLFDLTIYLYYPIADLLIIFITGLIFLKFRGGKIAWPWFIVVAGFFIMSIADTYFNWLTWQDLYGSYSIFDVIYYLAYIVLIAGGLEMHKLLSKAE
ncbi:MAG: hypothetical protein ACFFD4_03750 [Candidatus Odinarchaeota archaeon]